MNRYFRDFLRLLLIRRHSSKLPTGILPLTDVKSVVIYLDLVEEHCQIAIIQITRFFEGRGIKVTIVSKDSADLRTKSDMFLAMNYMPDVSERYAARTSKARFKVGRHQIKGNVYDMVVSDPGEMPMKVDAFFKEVKTYLKLVK